MLRLDLTTKPPQSPLRIQFWGLVKTDLLKLKGLASLKTSLTAKEFFPKTFSSFERPLDSDISNRWS
jgi:hypothetical protein